MITNGTELKGDILGQLLKIILEFAWSDRQTCSKSDVIRSTAKPALSRPQTGVDVLHANALCSVADCMHNTVL